MVPLRPLPPPPTAWRALCAAAATGDVTAAKRALAWRLHRVPDIEGTAGWTTCEKLIVQSSLPAVLDKAATALGSWLLLAAQPTSSRRFCYIHCALQLSCCTLNLQGSIMIAGHRCQLTSQKACRRFSAPALNRFLAALFQALPPGMAAAKLQPVSAANRSYPARAERL